MPGAEPAARILAAVYLVSDDDDTVKALRPEWISGAVASKIELLRREGYTFSFDEIFPWHDEVSGTIDMDRFNRSLLVQPDLFLRVRPGRKITSIPGMQFISEHCIALPNGTKVEEYIELDRDAVVQDYSSQRVAEFFPRSLAAGGAAVWDCCAASGGKSILAYDAIPSIHLTVSDIRESILINLNKRFERAGIVRFRSFVKDIASTPVSATDRYQLIICDAPCSGSGTWSRTPEQLFYFDRPGIDYYSALQKRIVSNAVPALGNGGHFLYITCSVFRRENEEMVDFIKEKFHLNLVKMELLKGYDHKADTLFAALFSA